MNTILRETTFSGYLFQIVAGDITAETTQAIVNPANAALQHGGGLARLISKKGGPRIQKESDDWVRAHGPVGHADPAYTSAGELDFKYIFHAVGPVWSNHASDSAKLSDAVYGSLKKAGELGLTSLSLPAISTGIFGYPKDQAARITFETVERFFRDNPETRLQTVRLVLFDQPTLDAFLAEWDKRQA